MRTRILVRAALMAAAAIVVQSSTASALQVCARNDGAGHPRENSKLILRAACRVGKEVPIGIAIDGTVGDDAVVRIEGANLQVVNGTGATQNGENGLGNLVVGYNEENPPFTVRTGSHNLVLGTQNSYTSTGGIVSGSSSSILAPNASAVSGSGGIASGENSFVASGAGLEATSYRSVAIGGYLNESSAIGAVSIGGWYNSAGGEYSALVGGDTNTTSGGLSVILGGEDNNADGSRAALLGGQGNTVFGNWSSISGGQDNQASWHWSSISGGNNRTVAGNHDWAAGSLFEDF